MEQDYKYMVCTRCFTFNHAPYIVDAMNGFTMQETTFPVVTLIVDDASTDGEQEVIRQYLSEHFQKPYRTEETEYAYIIYARHKTNSNCEFIVFLLKYNHYSIKKLKMPYLSQWLDNAKYHALCEGDDYWTSTHKLQMQIEFMEGNKDYLMCFHCALEHWENSKQKDRIFSQIRDRDYKGVEFFEKWIVPTASIVIKSTVVKSQLYQRVREAKLTRGDTSLFCTAATLGRTRGMAEVMSVYRRSASGFTMQIKNYEWASIFVRDTKQFPTLFGHEYLRVSKSLISKIIVDYSIRAIIHGKIREAFNYVGLADKEDYYYIFKGLLAFPFRLMINKLIKYT